MSGVIAGLFVAGGLAIAGVSEGLRILGTDDNAMNIMRDVGFFFAVVGPIAIFAYFVTFHADKSQTGYRSEKNLYNAQLREWDERKKRGEPTGRKPRRPSYDTSAFNRAASYLVIFSGFFFVIMGLVFRDQEVGSADLQSFLIFFGIGIAVLGIIWRTQIPNAASSQTDVDYLGADYTPVSQDESRRRRHHKHRTRRLRHSHRV